MKPTDPESKSAPEAVDTARRTLLRVGAYVAPAVLATLVTRRASAQEEDCSPDTGIVLCSCTPHNSPPQCTYGN
jgi:hypothetical protein